MSMDPHLVAVVKIEDTDLIDLIKAYNAALMVPLDFDEISEKITGPLLEAGFKEQLDEEEEIVLTEDATYVVPIYYRDLEEVEVGGEGQYGEAIDISKLPKGTKYVGISWG